MAKVQLFFEINKKCGKKPHWVDSSIKCNFVLQRYKIERENVASVARELGISENILRRWKAKHDQSKHCDIQGCATPRQGDVHKENQWVKKELDRQKLENEILKKALGIISASDR